MWKGPTILMESQYPFFLPENSELGKHLVKKKIPKTDRHLQRARTLAGLKHDCLIKLESASEQKGQHYLLFEHVKMPLDKWYATVTREFIENYEQRLILFSRYLADRGILTSFCKENMGVSDSGDAKYFLDTTFEVDSAVDKLHLKKKYKEQIKNEIQFYIDKKVHCKQPSNKITIPEKKENTKILKILEALEKGKANLCAETPKETNFPSQALVSQQVVVDSKATLKPIKNIQNVIIQKEINKVNKIHVMVNNKPVETLQQQFKREYASSSFYINGLPAVVLEREGQTKRLFSPNDKFARFEEVKYKEYKSMKTSGEIYVQDFISVLQAEDSEKITSPGSPRATIRGPPKISIQGSPRATFHGSPPQKQQLTSPPVRLALEAEPKPQKPELFRPPELKMGPEAKIQTQQIREKEWPGQHLKRGVSPRNINTKKVNTLYVSDKGIKPPPLSTAEGSPNIKGSCQVKGSSQGNNRANELQKKVSEAIANSLNAINKFKSSKGQATC